MPSSSIAEGDAEAAGGHDERTAGIDGLVVGDCLGDRDIDNAPVLPSHHAVEAAHGNEIDRMDPKRRSDDAVARLRRAATLDMAQHGYAGLCARQLGDALADVVA